MHSSSSPKWIECQSNGSRCWHIHSAIVSLKQKLNDYSKDEKTKYSYIISDICDILSEWALQWSGKSEWNSFLNRRTFLHEVEESIIPLYEIINSFEDRINNNQQKNNIKLNVIDLCCGKGFFCMLLLFLTTKYNILQYHIKRIIMIEKQSDIDWYHIYEANKYIKYIYTNNENIIQIDIWSGVNIHDTSLLNRIHNDICMNSNSIINDNNISINDNNKRIDNNFVVLVGIHLCKRLSSRFIEIINYFIQYHYLYQFILAPCCLPRFSGVVTIKKHFHNNYNNNIKQIKNSKFKYVKYNKKWDVCWKCGMSGHNRYECSSINSDIAVSDQDAVVQRDNIGNISSSVDVNGQAIRDMSEDNADVKERDIAYTSTSSVQQNCSSEVVSDIVNMDMRVIGESQNPFQAWCNFLLGAINIDSCDKSMYSVCLGGMSSDVLDNNGSFVDVNCCNDPVTDTSSVHDSKDWNSCRKLTWMVTNFN
jgi:hypothetical protein